MFYLNCVLHNYIKYVYYCIHWLSYYCMIHCNVCNDRGKYCAIMWSSGNYCGLLDLDNPLAHQAIGLKS